MLLCSSPALTDWTLSIVSVQGISVVPPGATMASAHAFIETQMRRAVAARREFDSRQLGAPSQGAGRHLGLHKHHDAR